MRRRTLAVLLGAIATLMLVTLGCSVSQLLARSSVTVTPTRTPRPTWTPVPGALLVASPTLDVTRFPGVVLPTPVQPTAQFFVPGSDNPIFVPQPAEGGPSVQTVVVVIVTATPKPPATFTPGPPTLTPGPTDTPGPPTATPTATYTPLPPVVVKVSVNNANVRQGPSNYYPVVARLKAGTDVTVVGRNRAGDWWKICCVNGVDVWIAASVVTAVGPIWAIPEVLNIPPAPPTAPPPPTPVPTPTYAWPFRPEGAVQQFPLGQDIFRIEVVIYNGSTPLWNYKVRVRKLSTGGEWISAGSEAYWNWTVTQWPTDNKSVNANQDCPVPRVGLACIKANVKWDSNSVQIPGGNDQWEVTVVDGGGKPQSQAVRIATNVDNSQWYYIVFTSRP